MTGPHVAVLVRAPAKQVAELLAQHLADAEVSAVDDTRCVVRSATLRAFDDAELARIIAHQQLPVAGWKRHG